jgi:tetratricopeptide (TPR) repeat protein
MSTYPYDLGSHRRPVTTRSGEAQAWFDRGLNWCYGFNHEEAIRCFHKAVESDPDCAMAHWGIAYAWGPNYNKKWEAFDPADLDRSLTAARKALARALATMHGASDVEKALIAALADRYPSDEAASISPGWNDGYAAAMREVARAYPDDLDVSALTAEALMNRTPWLLWDLTTGRAADGADTSEARRTLEHALSRPGGMAHPGLLHMYIHLMEMSPEPESALEAADALRALVPDAGHLRHMATHIDVLCGHYRDVVASNASAIEADRKYCRLEGAENFYSLYRCHNLHFKLYGALFLGRFRQAIEAADELVAELPESLLRIPSPPMADWLEAFVPMRFHVLIRFGRWRDIIAAPLPVDEDLFCVTTAVAHYAKAVAHAATGAVALADVEAEAFARAREKVPPSRYLFVNTCQDILAVADEMMRGEIAYRRGDVDGAFAHLRRSVELDDGLPYDEPWGWMQPTRHALGALLLEQGRIEDAEAVYRADLGLDKTVSRARQHPDNIWSLHGLHECLVKLGKVAEAEMIEPRLAIATALADTPVKSSCFCRMATAA